MKRYTLFSVLMLLIFNVTSAQTSSVFGSVAEAKSKIERTVPLVVEHLKKISESQNDNSILTNGTTALKKEYDAVALEFDLYRGNMASCIVNKSSKKASKCMNYHTLYFRNTLGNYDNFINYLTKKNGYLGVEDDSVKKDFKPTEIATKIDTDFTAASKAAGKLRGTAKASYFEQVKSEDFKLAPFDTLLN
ncbi:hypothetical protein NAL32_20940 [Chryseobacterium sp. Ch-15]|uniref:Uncharacterized protein n=1 Tax=Chryseobacterium muglaense TaxID=2893752 RepID=A0A9Q3USJ2_9FLAO|nr:MULTISPECIES: hypothetical protein [Chryseobacterium]MBD3904418.1 hypothetical protein [Chryseobacterium muglaense]MBO6185736.1 hypothetical protein [Chryseobacterium sp.]MCC9032746.1 hypothetical protein [Chryseobacterium muglaense]MCM2556859.1 hypothetical protein [Chryseobacterium muglaense]